MQGCFGTSVGFIPKAFQSELEDPVNVSRMFHSMLVTIDLVIMIIEQLRMMQCDCVLLQVELNES